MGTKICPGRFDCHAAALPDEEMFVLLARDPLAPGLTKLWGAIRTANRDLIFSAISELQGFVPEFQSASEHEKAVEAYQCAEAMRAWRTENYCAWRKASEPEGAAA